MAIGIFACTAAHPTYNRYISCPNILEMHRDRPRLRPLQSNI